jgi:hypothetical protein
MRLAWASDRPTETTIKIAERKAALMRTPDRETFVRLPNPAIDASFVTA